MADMRWPLRMREYVGLLNIVGCTNTIMDTLPMLEDRAEKAGVYERLEAARDELDAIFAAILRTVPAEKLIRIQMDMKHTIVVQIRPKFSMGEYEDWEFITKRS